MTDGPAARIIAPTHAADDRILMASLHFRRAGHIIVL